MVHIFMNMVKNNELDIREDSLEMIFQHLLGYKKEITTRSGGKNKNNKIIAQKFIKNLKSYNSIDSINTISEVRKNMIMMIDKYIDQN